MRLALIRHGPTDWNGQKRLQGRTDRALSAAGRAAVSLWKLPHDIAGFAPCSSPLIRARETANILFGRHVPDIPALTEMSFGAWEGERLPDLRARLGPEMAENEALGLDFTPPDGESPRMVLARVTPQLSAWTAAGQDIAAVSHKGVIRALYAQAVGWDMTGRSPDKLRWDAAHLFEIRDDGSPTVVSLNLAMI